MNYVKHKNIIHQRLKSSRIKAGLSQEQLAAKMQTMAINIDQQSISKIERDKRTVADYEVIFFAKALNIQPSWLFDGYKDLSS